MIISTRYRDIPYDEARRCWNQAIRDLITRDIWESQVRGKPVKIIAGIVAPNAEDTCSGPFFNIYAPHVSYQPKCCAHFVEIGDC